VDWKDYQAKPVSGNELKVSSQKEKVYCAVKFYARLLRQKVWLSRKMLDDDFFNGLACKNV
jgi:hypothetical protein